MTDERLKRLKVRAWRRGIKEMDLLLGTYVDREGPGLDPDTLDRLEALMEENDLDLYAWVTGQQPAPEAHAPLIAEIARHAGPPAR